MSATLPPSEDTGTEDESSKPPRSLSAIYAEIEENLQTKMKRAGLKVPRMAYGAQHLDRLSSPPRIVGVPYKGRAGGVLNRSGSGIEKAWALWGRFVLVNFHVWDVDDTATEVLANHLVASIHDQCAGLYEMTGEEWGPSKDTKLGNELVVQAQIYTIWSREFIPAVTPTTVEIAGHVTEPTS